jgi:hypothetical protein
MPLHTNRMEEKSDAVRYAVKQYRAKGKQDKVKSDKQSSPDKAADVKEELQVVKIKRQPIRSAWERFKDYFR